MAAAPGRPVIRRRPESVDTWQRAILPGFGETPALPGEVSTRMHWFEGCGHFPQWDVPEQTARLILANTARLGPADALTDAAQPEQAA